VAKKQISKTLTGLAGEFLVAAQLCLRGHVASLTLKSYPGVDTFALNPRTGRQSHIQVKTTLGAHEYYVSSPATVEKTATKFVFVYIDPTSKRPQFLVVPGTEVAQLAQQAYDAYLQAHPNVDPNQPWMVNLTQLRPYEDRWENLDLDE